jgi:hypothetical protein
MQALTIIVAAGWIEWAGPVVVFILYTIGQLVMNQGKRPAQQQRPPQKQRPVAGPQPQPQQPKSLEEKLRTEVEEFLRQVKGEKTKQEEPVRTVVAQRPPLRRVERPAELVVESAPERVSVQEHVARHMSTADVTEHATTLGTDVSQADERFQSQLQDRFQHQIGSLEPRQQQPTQVTRRRSAAAAEIADLLRSPQGMRQVIIASEVLRRPEF